MDDLRELSPRQRRGSRKDAKTPIKSAANQQDGEQSPPCFSMDRALLGVFALWRAAAFPARQSLCISAGRQSIAALLF